MSRLLRVSVPMLVMALALLAIAGPAAAHLGYSGDAPPRTPSPVDTVVPRVSAAPGPPAPSWSLPAVLALAAAVSWRRARRAGVVALLVVLCVFAFENALHSVHHGLDPPQQAECAVAAAATHLAAVQVDTVAPPAPVLPLAGEAVESTATHTPIRVRNPDQGRAPPSAIR